MATSLQKVYDNFLSKVEADDWMLTDDISAEIKADWKMLLDAAIFEFRYAHIPLEYDEETEMFETDLTNDEVQILGSLMKLMWMRRCLATWDNIRQLYSDKDFSQANFLDKLNKTSDQLYHECRLMLDKYNRSSKYKPSTIFGQLAGEQ